MRIGVLRTQVPFVSGGAERHAASLCAALIAHGHDAVEITVPFKWYPAPVLADHILAAKMLDLTEVEGVPVDMLIGLKFPAYLVPHPNKLFWVIHQHRQAYDMWDSGQSDLLDDPQGGALRALIMDEDRAAFAQSPHPIFANSGNVAGRLQRHLGLESQPLYHPPPNADRMQRGAFGDYLFAPGRINPSKRLDLILRALAASRSKIPLVIAGVAENPAYQDQLMQLALELGVAGHVTWLGPVDDDTLLRHYAEACAVVFVPEDEDYGYITLEAMLAGKPVITTTRSGGPLEFIRDGQEGWVTAPEPAALATAFEAAMSDRTRAENLGQAGFDRYHAMGISWSHVVETLTGQAAAPGALHPEPAPEPFSAAQGAPEPEEAGDPMAEALSALKAAVAPPAPPQGLAFGSIEEVLGAYAFEELPGKTGLENPPIDQGLAGYLGTHWTRFLTTLSLLEGVTINKALDVGVFPPLVFQALLANHSPGVEMAGLWEGPSPYTQKVAARRPDLPGFDIRLEPANSERDRWPFADASVDLVTGMEILEHLALDPFWFFSEAARVLKPGGHLLLTTPNVVSHRGVWKTLNGIAPYSFGIFVPSGGVYGRHNREYAPPELAELGEAAGFETQKLTTYDVYDRDADPATADLLVNRGDDLDLRGETIFYLATKTDRAPAVPERFYHGRPDRMDGAITLVDQDARTGLVRLDLHNRSAAWWPIADHAGTSLLAEWIDGEGDLQHQYLFQPLTAPVAPGGTGRVTVRLAPDAGAGEGALRLHLYQIGVGVMTGSGRADTFSLPCSEAAFLQLVRTTRPAGPAP